MTNTQRYAPLSLIALLGLAACSSGTSEPASGNGGTVTETGGSSSSGGTTTTPPATGGLQSTGGQAATGGAKATGGVAQTGGSMDTGGSAETGGSMDTGGIASKGGSPAATGGTGSPATGGAAGGTARTGGASGSGGKAGSGGTPATGGAAGDTGGSAAGGGTPPPPPPPGTIPAGYPTPTADNRAKCQPVTIGTAASNDACGGQPTGDTCIECLFGGTDYNISETTPTATATSEAGNYLVTVTLGGAAAGQTYFSAESTRGMLQAVTTTPGQSLTYAFVVNVRAMEGQPKHAGGPGGYPGLDLFFSGPAATPPQVSAIGYALATAATKPIMVYIASDSTTCDQTGGAFGGWGQMLPEFFGPPVGIANYANSGASSSDYGFFGDISSRWAPGDYFIIQFGHNDKSASDAQVQANLTTHVNAALAAKVNPIVVAPPPRISTFPLVLANQSVHEAAAKAAAAAANVPFIDLTSLAVTWYNTLGSKAAAMAFHANGTDATHTNIPGAEKLAGLVAGDIKAQKLPLAQYLRQ